MKVGVNLLSNGDPATPTTFEATVAIAEGLGYHLVMVSDHVAVTSDVQARYPAPFYDPFALLAWIAGITCKVELGTTVAILPYRHPLQLARVVASIDQLSRGRFILGVGAGWAEQEFQALGIPFDRRGALSDECLEALKALWTADVASYSGELLRFEDVHSGPRPARRPHPPVWVGGHSPAALRRAVKHGDAWHPIRVRPGGSLAEGLATLSRIADEHGRAVPALCPRIRLRLTEWREPDEERLMGEGTLDQIRADLDELAELDAQYVLLDPHPDGGGAGPRATWSALATLAERALDLANETVV